MGILGDAADKVKAAIQQANAANILGGVGTALGGATGTSATQWAPGQVIPYSDQQEDLKKLQSYWSDQLLSWAEAQAVKRNSGSPSCVTANKPVSGGISGPSQVSSRIG